MHQKLILIVGLFFYLLATYTGYMLLSIILLKVPASNLIIFKYTGYIIFIWFACSVITAGCISLGQIRKLGSHPLPFIFLLALLVNIGIGVIPILIFLSGGFEQILTGLIITLTPTLIIGYHVIGSLLDMRK